MWNDQQAEVNRAGKIYEAKLDNMTPREAMIMAYGILWRDAPSTHKAVTARMVLKHQLTHEERKIGIRLAIDAYGPVTTNEILTLDFPVNDITERG